MASRFSSDTGHLTPLAPELAEIMALRVLTWLAERADLFDHFTGSTGISVDQLSQNAHDATLLGGVLDFILADEAVLLDLCQELDIPPELPLRARAGLPGGDVPHWT